MLGTSDALAFADVVRHFQEARTLYFSLSGTINNKQRVSMRFTMAEPGYLRIRDPHSTTIFDQEKGEGLLLISANNQAFSLDPDDKTLQQANSVVKMIEWLKSAREQSVDDLGPRQIDGKATIGFRVRRDHQDYDFWVDPKSGMPVRVDFTMKFLDHQYKGSMSEFVFDAELDESLFSMTPPEGYSVAGKLDVTPPGEKDLIHLLRKFANANDGQFPDALDLKTATEIGKKQGPQALANANDMQAMMKLTRGYMFIQLKTAGNGFQYAGKNVKLGDAESVVCSWKEEAKSTYRAVFGDLTIRDVDAAALPNRASKD